MCIRDRSTGKGTTEMVLHGKKFFLLGLLLVIFGTIYSSGLIHHLKIRDDTRPVFRIETFGFFSGGILNLTATGIKVTQIRSDQSSADKPVAFLLRRTETDYISFIEESESRDCLITENDKQSDDIVLRLTPGSNKIHAEHIIAPDNEGYYSIIFVNCIKFSKVDFDLDLVMYNPGPNYLSAGLTPLPTLFTILFFVYIVILAVWVLYFMRGAAKKVFLIHHLMTLFVILKILSLLFKAIEYHYTKTVGHAGGWAIVYYFFAGLKGIMMFVIIALIGTGWAFLKPFLSEKDKKIFLFIIPLQIISNIAIIVLEETAPGSQGWFTWKEVFRLVDIACCGAILLPIIWSIKHLRDAAQIDGKAKRNMEKLNLFKQFYLLVVCYIYFTRIVIFLMDATLPFKYLWLGDLWTELATISFWCAIGWKFQPVVDNPYLALNDSGDEEDDEETVSGKEGKAQIEMEDMSRAGSKKENAADD
eukprot:TRINITY_DN4570_c0_g1_i1.p1 TRINITY_DN4570_c0_g1~~TRINITY_DN4570_c0_g1_i1.p1  ORF type:complete len:474 (-),score=55.27 TRINITY_DN4570_c0_g1_i1:66-1487(-)